MGRSTLIAVIALVAGLALPVAATAANAGRATAVRVYAATDGPRAGELEVRVIARYPARASAAGRGPFYGYTEVTLRGPGGSLRLHDLDRLAHPRHAEQFDHRVEISRSRARTLLGGRRSARLRVTTRSVVLGPLARSSRAASAALAAVPRASQVLPLREVRAFPPRGGRMLATPRGLLRIVYALEPGTTGTYDPIVSQVQPAWGRPVLTDLSVPGNGALRALTPTGRAPDDESAFDAAFSIRGTDGTTCKAWAEGRISGITAGLGGALDFYGARYEGIWTGVGYGGVGRCTPALNGILLGLPNTWMDEG